MARSIKKGPYIDHNVEKKVVSMNESEKKSVIKTWSRSSTITPEMVDGYLTDLESIVFALDAVVGVEGSV